MALFIEELSSFEVVGVGDVAVHDWVDEVWMDGFQNPLVVRDKIKDWF